MHNLCQMEVAHCPHCCAGANPCRQPNKPSRQSSGHSDDLTPNIHAGIVTAREKNRQAQRRFRERQKSLITELRDKVYHLEKQVCSSVQERGSDGSLSEPTTLATMEGPATLARGDSLFPEAAAGC